MKKWLKIGAALLLVAWAPFIYAELTSSPAEKKARDLPGVEDEEEITAEPVEPGGVTTGGKSAAAPAEPSAAQAPAAQEVAPAKPQAKTEPAAEDPAAEPGTADPAEPVEVEEEVAGEDEAQEEEAPPPVASGPTAQLAHAFETEPRDALWAKDTERRIATVFSGDEMPEGMLQRTSCRRAVCKLDVRWTRDHATQYVGVYEALREQFGTEVAVAPEGTIDESGQQTVHLYVLRKGYTAADVAK